MVFSKGSLRGQSNIKKGVKEKVSKHCERRGRRCQSWSKEAKHFLSNKEGSKHCGEEKRGEEQYPEVSKDCGKE